MKLGIAKLAESCNLDLPTVDMEADAIDLDTMQDHANIEVAYLQLDDLNKFVATVERIHTYVTENGCTKELVALVGEDLNTHGVTLEVGKKDEALVALEGFMDDVKKGDIKAVLVRIVDMIIRIFQKFNDANKLQANALDELLRGKLSDITKFDPVKFQEVLASIHSKKEFNIVVGGYSRIDYRSSVNAKTPTDSLSEIISSVLPLLKASGYEVNGDTIVRISGFEYPRKKMSDHDWKLSDIKSMVSDTKIMLEHLRAQASKSARTLRKEIKLVKEDEHSVNILRAEMQAMMKVIVVFERTSLFISKQVMQVPSKLKIKK
jgi:hypothetical protein